jgi:hypothetical protein
MANTTEAVADFSKVPESRMTLAEPFQNRVWKKLVDGCAPY